MDTQGVVLIVEDEVELRKIMKQEFEDFGLEVVTANNGIEAIEKLRFHDVDAIISDLNMPTLSGTQLLQILRANGYHKPFLVLTGHGTRTEAVELLRLGAMDFFDKPMDMSQLLQKVQLAVTLGKALPKLRTEFIEQLGLKDAKPSVQMEQAITQIAQLRFLRQGKTDKAG